MVAQHIDPAGLNLEERVVQIWRCAVVVKGGRRFSFAAMVVVGNGDGVVGVGFGKAREVPTSIEKAVKDARKNLVRVSTYGTTIPHEVIGKYGTAKVTLIPALPGTGIIAGSAVRAVLESIGVHDVLTKSIGKSNNAKNLVKAAMEGLMRLRQRDFVARLRGIEIPEDAALVASVSARTAVQASAERLARMQPARGGGGGGGRRRGPRGPGDSSASGLSPAVASAGTGKTPEVDPKDASASPDAPAESSGTETKE